MVVALKNTALLESNSLSLSAHSEENRSQKECMLLSRNHRDLPIEEACNFKRQNPDAKYSIIFMVQTGGNALIMPCV